jgi:hypothetical protein
LSALPALPAVFAITTAPMTSFSHSAMSVIASFGPQTSDSPDIINLGNGLVHSTSTPKKKNPFDSQRYIFLSTYKIYYTTLVGSLVSEPSRAG